MYMLKLLFQQLQRDKIHPGSWENSGPPGTGLKITWGTAKDHRLGTSGGIPAIVLQGGANDHPPLGTANCPGQECCSFFYLIFPEFQNPSPCFSLL